MKLRIFGIESGNNRITIERTPKAPYTEEQADAAKKEFEGARKKYTDFINDYSRKQIRLGKLKDSLKSETDNLSSIVSQRKSCLDDAVSSDFSFHRLVSAKADAEKEFQSMKDEKASLEARYKSLSDSVTEKSGLIASYNEAVAKCIQNMAPDKAQTSHEEYMENLSEYKALNVKITDLKKKLPSLKASRDKTDIELKALIADFNAQPKKIEHYKDAISEYIETNKDSSRFKAFRLIEDRRKASEDKIESLRRRIASLARTLSDLNSKASVVKADLTGAGSRYKHILNKQKDFNGERVLGASISSLADSLSSILGDNLSKIKSTVGSAVSANSPTVTSVSLENLEAAQKKMLSGIISDSSGSSLDSSYNSQILSTLGSAEKEDALKQSLTTGYETWLSQQTDHQDSDTQFETYKKDLIEDDITSNNGLPYYEWKKEQQDLGKTGDAISFQTYQDYYTTGDNKAASGIALLSDNQISYVRNSNFDYSTAAKELAQANPSGNDASLSVGEYSVDSSSGSSSIKAAPWVYGNQPFDVRLIRNDGFLNGGDVIPFSASNTSSLFSDMVEIAIDTSSNSGTHPGHLTPRNSAEAKRLSRNINLYGTQAVVNPYSTIRLYNGMTSVKQYNNKYLAADHRMLDIRDNRRFYDIWSRSGKGLVDQNGNADILSVSNPTVTNIIDIMCKDMWGRTPYSFQDFVFCKYFGRIPNNHLITLRKYLAPVYDNLCWEEMQVDKKKLNTSFAPVATMVTYFGGESGNDLKDIFNITTGVKWGSIKSEIHDVTGDTGTPMGEVDENQMTSFGGLDYTPGYEMLTTLSSNLASLMKFFGMVRSPMAFDKNAALTEKYTENLQDPNENGPYSNRIKGPLNRIDEVMKREAGIEFSNDITLKFAYVARPIGGMNTKAVMLDILSNVLLMCSATAVFWGGGYKYMIQPHGYPWNSVWGGKGMMKKMYNGDILGKNGVIADWIGGLTHFTGATGDNWWEKVLSAFGNLGAAFLGSLSAMADGLISTLTGQASELAGDIANNASSMLGLNTTAVNKGKSAVSNILSNAKSAWAANSVKQTLLPYIGGMKALLIGTPVGNWHLTVGNPLNPIAVIGNLICEDVQFQFGEELGPDDFPTELECTVKLKHGMARDLAAIESMFNRGAGRIYQIPDYTRMYGAQPSSDLETRVDNFTGGTAFRVPMNWTRFTGQASGYGTYSVSKGKANAMAGSWNSNIALPVEKTEVIDYDYGQFSAKYSQEESQNINGYRSIFLGNMATRKIAEG